MPYKKGGGGWYQLYDADNGQYTDEQKAKMLENDQKTLELYLKHRMVAPGNEPAFPVESIHDEEYRRNFVLAYRHQFHGWGIPDSKIDWLFQYHKENDKSHYLLETIGYTKYETKLLYKHIRHNTEFDKIKYSRIAKHKYFLCKALTKLKNGMYATTTWELHSDDLEITFVSLLPGRKTYDED